MKRIISCSIILIILIFVAIILINHLSVPEHVRKDDEPDSTLIKTETVIQDPRVQTALEEGKESIYEDEGLDIPYSGDMLLMIEHHFGAEIEFIGAGLHRGEFKKDIAIELFLNPKGNVGQVQLCIGKDVTEIDTKEALTKYALFSNANLSVKEAEVVAQEAFDTLSNLSNGETHVYFNHVYNVGFAGLAQDDNLYIYFP